MENLKIEWEELEVDKVQGTLKFAIFDGEVWHDREMTRKQSTRGTLLNTQKIIAAWLWDYLFTILRDGYHGESVENSTPVYAVGSPDFIPNDEPVDEDEDKPDQYDTGDEIPETPEDDPDELTEEEIRKTAEEIINSEFGADDDGQS